MSIRLLWYIQCLSFHLFDDIFFFLMIRRPPRSTLDRSSAASDVYKRQVYTHAVDGARELYLELVNDYSTLEKFNERRLIMAHDARMNLKKWDSITCRDCHKDPNPPGADAQEAHKKLKTEGATCIDCHQNLVHEEVAKTDLNASLAAGKMVLQQEEDGGEDEEGEDLSLIHISEPTRPY